MADDKDPPQPAPDAWIQSAGLLGDDAGVEALYQAGRRFRKGEGDVSEKWITPAGPYPCPAPDDPLLLYCTPKEFVRLAPCATNYVFRHSPDAFMATTILPGSPGQPDPWLAVWEAITDATQVVSLRRWSPADA